MGGTYAQALAEAQRLAACIRAYGVAVSIEIQQGVSTSGWLDSRKVGVLAHHTVSSRAQGNTPCLALVKRGRSDVPGPLCNGYGGFDEVYRIITMGWANHPGLGGPLTLAGVTIPQNNGRPYLWGTEFEGGINLADFTPSYRSFMARAHLGVLDYLGRPIEAHGEHLTWAPGRKVDRLQYTTASGRAELYAAKAAHEAAQVVEAREDTEDMATIIMAGTAGAYLLDGGKLFGLSPDALASAQAAGLKSVTISRELYLQWSAQGAPVNVTVDLDEAALAAALAPKLGVVSLSDADVERVADETADRFSTRLAQ